VSMFEKVRKAKEYLKCKIKETPKYVVVLGSGLGSFVECLKDPTEIKYEDIPGWPLSTAPGHAGRLVYGKKENANVLVMQGRVHYYEGYSMEEVVFPVRVFGAMGVRYYIATNASGGINRELSPGDIVLVEDHINLLGDNPLRGRNVDEWGPRFPDMTKAYDREMIRLAEKCALETGEKLKRGVYIAFTGPSFETPAEIRMARVMGADVVGMSTVPEVITARHMGMRVCVFSCIANYAAGITDSPLTHEEVLEAMGKTAGKLNRILESLILALEANDV